MEKIIGILQIFDRKNNLLFKGHNTITSLFKENLYEALLNGSEENKLSYVKVAENTDWNDNTAITDTDVVGTYYRRIDLSEVQYDVNTESLKASFVVDSGIFSRKTSINEFGLFFKDGTLAARVLVDRTSDEYTLEIDPTKEIDTVYFCTWTISIIEFPLVTGSAGSLFNTESLFSGDAGSTMETSGDYSGSSGSEFDTEDDFEGDAGSEFDSEAPIGDPGAGGTPPWGYCDFEAFCYGSDSFYIYGGGQTLFGVSDSKMYKYSPTTNSWSEVTGLVNNPTYRSKGDACVVGDRAYMILGHHNGNAYTKIFEFNIPTKTFTELYEITSADVSDANYSALSVMYEYPKIRHKDGKLYIWFNQNNPNIRKGWLGIYDIAGDSFSLAADPNVARDGGKTMEIIGDYIYLFGGQGDGNSGMSYPMTRMCHEPILKYSIDSDSWTITGFDPYPHKARYCMNSCVIDAKIYLFCGRTRNYVGVGETFQPTWLEMFDTDYPERSIHRLVDAFAGFERRYAAGGALDQNGKLYLFRGVQYDADSGGALTYLNDNVCYIVPNAYE